jgi:hypothetical protein
MRHELEATLAKYPNGAPDEVVDRFNKRVSLYNKKMTEMLERAKAVEQRIKKFNADIAPYGGKEIE